MLNLRKYYPENHFQLLRQLLVVIVFLLPYERIPSVELPLLGGFTLRLSQIIGAIAIGLGLYLFATQQKERRLLTDKGSWILLLFLVTYSISSLLAADKARSIKTLVFTGFTMLICALFANYAQKKDFERYKKALQVTTIVVICFGFYQYFGDIFGISTSWTGLKDAYTKAIFGFPRIQSTALEPLYYGSFLLITIGLSFASLVKTKSRITQLLLFFATTQLFLTVSRGAVIGMIAMVVVIGVFSVKDKLPSYLRTVGLLFVAAIFAYLLTSIQNPFGISSNKEAGSAKNKKIIEQTTNLDSQADREINRKLAIDAFLTKPIFGIGPGNFNNYAKSHSHYYDNSSNNNIIVNNEPLELLAESGIVSFGVLITFLAWLLYRAVILAWNNSDPWAIGLLGYLAATAVQYQTFSTLYVLHIWVVVGMLYAAIFLNKQRSKKADAS